MRLCFFGFVLTGMLIGQHAIAKVPIPVRNHTIEVEDYFTLATMQAIAVSPSGQQVAYIEQRWDQEADGRTSELWVVDTASHQSQRLTFDEVDQGSPTWSPDGQSLYFTCGAKRAGADRPPYDGKTQVWRMPAGGGTAQPVTRVKGGIKAYQLAVDGSALYYTVADQQVDDPWKTLREEFEKLEYGHGVHDYSQLWKLDLQTWRSRKLVDEKRVIRSFRVSPDQSKIAMHTTPTAKLISNEGWSRVDVWDADHQQVTSVTPEGWRKDHPSPYGWIDTICFARDNQVLAFAIAFDGYPTKLYTVEWTGDRHSLQPLSRSHPATIVGGSLAWRGPGRDLLYLGDDHGRIRVQASLDIQEGVAGQEKVLTPGDVVVRRFDTSATGKQLVVLQHGLENGGDLYVVKSSQLERITQINPQMDTWKLPQISLVQWTAPDGTAVEGVLELPPDYQASEGPLPLVVEIHGGPTSASHYQFRYWIYGRTLMAAQGYALLSPNYRGSTGYGEKFMVDLIGRENNIEVADILAGVDALVGRGVADPQRMAVMGWSNGGYLTNCLITQTQQFKAASSGAGVLDQVIQWGTEDTPGHVINYMESLPWSPTDAYQKGSPLYHLDQVSTPTLIHVGEKDARVPPAHARALYRALKHYLDVPTELVVYPGAAHGLTTYQHRLAKMKWDLAWFKKYLAAEEGPEDKK